MAGVDSDAARRAARHARRPRPGTPWRPGSASSTASARASARSASDLGVTAEAARRLVNRALANLRDDAAQVLAA